MDIPTISRDARHRRRQASALACATLSALAFCVPAHAGDWSITPTINVNETFTDNVNLVPTAQAKSDFVTQVTPGLSVSTKGPNLTFNGYYGLQQTTYANGTNGSSLTNLLHADSTAKLIDNWLFLDTAASITQQNISAYGAQAVDNTSGSANRTSVRTTHISPYLSHAFDSDATAELRFARDSVAANSGGLDNSVTDTVSAKVNSGPAFREIGWGLQYSDQTIHYLNQGNVQLEDVVGTLSYLLAPRFRLIGTVGYDNNTYASLSNVSSGYSWSTGFDWKVSQRTSLSASFGHKYYGNTYALSAATRTRVASWTLSYNETVTTTPQEFSLPSSINTATYLNNLLSSTITDATARAQAVTELIAQSGLPATLTSAVNTFTNTVFLQKQWQAAVLLTGARTTLLLSAFDIRREPQSNVDLGTLVGTSDDTTVQTGGSAVLSRRLSEKLRLNTSLVVTRVASINSGLVYNNQTLRVGLTKQITPKLTGTLEVRRNQGQSNQVDTGYHEDAISAFFNLQL